MEMHIEKYLFEIINEYIKKRNYVKGIKMFIEKYRRF